MDISMLMDFINGPVRKSLEWLVGVGTVHPSLHRLKNALGLTGGMMAGGYVMDRVAGETLDGDKLDIEDTVLPLKPLHGAMAYNHTSDDPQDRTKAVADKTIRMGAGAVGAVLGSQNFGLEQPLIQEAEKVLKNPKLLTLDKAEEAALMLQGKVHRVLAGGTAVFGSSSNLALTPMNYGFELGATFLPYVKRNKIHTPWAPGGIIGKYVSGNNQPYAFGPTGMLGKLKSALLEHPEANPEEFRKMATAVLEPWFGERGSTKEHIDDFLKPLLEARDKVYKPGGVPAAARADLGKTLDGFLAGAGLEKHLLNNVKLNPAEAMIGRNGLIEFMARGLGAEEKLSKLEYEFQKSVISRHGGKALPNLNLNAAARAADRKVLICGNAVMAGMLSGVALMAYQALEDKKKRDSEGLNANGTSPVIDELLAGHKTVGTDGAAEKLAVSTDSPASENTAPEKKIYIHNGKRSGSPLLHAAERTVDMFNAPLSLGLHRSSLAAGLTIGGLIGMEICNAAAGKTLTGQPYPIERVPDFLKKVHNTMAYNANSPAVKDSWKKILHFGGPGITAAAGVVIASDMFFKARKKRIDGEAEYLEDFEDRATMAMANAFTLPTALTALPVTPSGLGCLPVLNYGNILGTRFGLAAGRKGVMPGLGEKWTGATSRFVEGPVKLRDRMIQEAVNNPAEYPENFDEMARGIVRQFFPEATNEQVYAFAEKMQHDREKFYQEGVGIPDNMKEKCEKLISKHFKDAGLEQTFRELKLDPMNAVLGNNGFSGTIAKYLGAAKPLEEINKEYKKKYTDRLAHSRERAGDQLAAAHI